jgi:hypothetical protein
MLPEHTMTADDAVEMAREKYVQLARARTEAGREIPARGISLSAHGDFAREQVEVSQELLRTSRRSTFSFSMSLAEIIERAAARRAEREARESVEEDCR